MAKIQIKSEKLTSFGGIFPIMEKFDRMLSHTIVSTLDLRSKMPPSGTGNRISLYFFSPWQSSSKLALLMAYRKSSKYSLLYII